MVFAYVQMALDVNYIHGKYLAVKLFIKNRGQQPPCFIFNNELTLRKNGVNKCHWN